VNGPKRGKHICKAELTNLALDHRDPGNTIVLHRDPPSLRAVVEVLVIARQLSPLWSRVQAWIRAELRRVQVRVLLKQWQ